jgi:hypothetical protein
MTLYYRVKHVIDNLIPTYLSSLLHILYFLRLAYLIPISTATLCELIIRLCPYFGIRLIYR